MARRLSAGVAAALLAACATTTTQRVVYTPLGAPAAHPFATRLVVVPFADGRPPRVYPAPRDSALRLLLPLVPSVTVDYERLDESRAAERLIRGALPQREDLFEDALARAVAADLAAARLFDGVELAASPPPDADLVLGGTIVSTRFVSSTTAYLLGAPGLLLWLTGLPNGRDTVEMAIDLALRDRDGVVLWQYPLRAEASRVVTLYTGGGHQLSTGAGGLSIPRYGDNDKGIDPDSLWAFHSEALRAGMAAARRSLAAYLGSRQRSMPPDA
ncbi:hypothetical protein KF840_13800 [bacterium]|nr:hypothetical protein [bacterium]